MKERILAAVPVVTDSVVRRVSEGSLNKALFNQVFPNKVSFNLDSVNKVLCNQDLVIKASFNLVSPSKDLFSQDSVRFLSLSSIISREVQKQASVADAVFSTDYSQDPELEGHNPDPVSEVLLLMTNRKAGPRDVQDKWLSQDKRSRQDHLRRQDPVLRLDLLRVTILPIPTQDFSSLTHSGPDRSFLTHFAGMNASMILTVLATSSAVCANAESVKILHSSNLLQRSFNLFLYNKYISLQLIFYTSAKSSEYSLYIIIYLEWR